MQPDHEESFGKGFNLILAVKEYGPARIEEIGDRLLELSNERQKLEDEMHILMRLVNAAATE